MVEDDENWESEELGEVYQPGEELQGCDRRAAEAAQAVLEAGEESNVVPLQTRNAAGQWVKGQSGLGHLKQMTPEALKSSCRSMTREILNTLFSIVTDPTAANRDRTAAAALLLERGYGKAALSLALEGAGQVQGIILLPALQGNGEGARLPELTGPEQ